MLSIGSAWSPIYLRVKPRNADGFVNWLMTHLITALGSAAVMVTRARVARRSRHEICRLLGARDGDHRPLRRPRLSHGSGLAGLDLTDLGADPAGAEETCWVKSICPDGTDSDNDGDTCACLISQMTIHSIALRQLRGSRLRGMGT